MLFLLSFSILNWTHLNTGGFVCQEKTLPYFLELGFWFLLKNRPPFLHGKTLIPIDLSTYTLVKTLRALISLTMAVYYKIHGVKFRLEGWGVPNPCIFLCTTPPIVVHPMYDLVYMSEIVYMTQCSSALKYTCMILHTYVWWCVILYTCTQMGTCALKCTLGCLVWYTRMI